MNPDPDEHVHPGQEDLQWGEGIKEKHREKKPQSKYWAISEQARKMIPGESQCKMFCGGKACKYCTAENWTEEQMVVNGLYSEWVTDNILAMARMSSPNIEKYKMIQQFQELGIKTVINLQQPGEHAFCGAGNLESGFSYNPQVLMEAEFFFYNFAMEDYGVASLSTLLDIVKVMQFAVSLGKVAVHCHAGLGRTGMLIACYLIYNNRVKAHKAIQYVRSRRPGAIQTKHQMKTCHNFEQHIQLYYVVFASKIPDSHPVTFGRFLIRQRHLLHGYESRKLKHIPKVIYVCCERLLELCGKGNALSSLRNQSIDPLPADLISIGSSTMRDHSPSSYSNLSEAGSPSPRFHGHHQQLSNTKHKALKESLSSSELSGGKQMKGKKKLTQTFSQPVDLQTCKNYPNQAKLHPDSAKISGSAVSDDDSDFDIDARVRKSNPDDEDDDDCIVYGQNDEDRKQAEAEARKAEEQEIRIFKERSASLDSSVSQQLMSTQEICEAIVKMEVSQQIVARLDSLENKLNKADQAWQELANEEDPTIICGVMCDWLEQLNGPVLTPQDVLTLIGNSSDPQKALLCLEKSTKHFLEYIILVISKLHPVPEHCLEGVLEFFLCFLCQEKLNIRYFLPVSRYSSFRDAKPENASQLFTLFLNLLEDEIRKAKKTSL